LLDLRRQAAATRDACSEWDVTIFHRARARGTASRCRRRFERGGPGRGLLSADTTLLPDARTAGKTASDNVIGCSAPRRCGDEHLNAPVPEASGALRQLRRASRVSASAAGGPHRCVQSHWIPARRSCGNVTT